MPFLLTVANTTLYGFAALAVIVVALLMLFGRFRRP